MALFENTQQPNDGFPDRRSNAAAPAKHATERRQFGNSHIGLSPAALELAQAIDDYKMKYRRRYITCEEMLKVIQTLGYAKQEEAIQPCGQ